MSMGAGNSCPMAQRYSPLRPVQLHGSQTMTPTPGTRSTAHPPTRPVISRTHPMATCGRRAWASPPVEDTAPRSPDGTTRHAAVAEVPTSGQAGPAKTIVSGSGGTEGGGGGAGHPCSSTPGPRGAQGWGGGGQPDSEPLRPSPSPGRVEDFGAAHSEECGILSGCENGRCVRVADGFTCLCHEGYRLDPAHMACLGKSCPTPPLPPPLAAHPPAQRAPQGCGWTGGAGKTYGQLLPRGGGEPPWPDASSLHLAFGPAAPLGPLCDTGGWTRAHAGCIPQAPLGFLPPLALGGPLPPRSGASASLLTPAWSRPPGPPWLAFIVTLLEDLPGWGTKLESQSTFQTKEVLFGA